MCFPVDRVEEETGPRRHAAARFFCLVLSHSLSHPKSFRRSTQFNIAAPAGDACGVGFVSDRLCGCAENGIPCAISKLFGPVGFVSKWALSVLARSRPRHAADFANALGFVSRSIQHRGRPPESRLPLSPLALRFWQAIEATVLGAEVVSNDHAARKGGRSTP